MPKATAVWLIDNTTLTFEQVAHCCQLHELEVPAIADGEVAIGIQGLDPIAGGELTKDEIERCEADPEARLAMAKPLIPQPKKRRKGARYTPVSKRQDRPDAIAWLLRNYPELSDAQISRLIGTTKPTISAIRDRSHWNSPNIKPQNPVGLGLCAGDNLEKVVAVARARAGIAHSPGASMAPDGINPVAMTSELAPSPKPAPEPEPTPQRESPTEAAVPLASEASLPTKPVEPAPESNPLAEPKPKPELAPQLEPVQETTVPPVAGAALPTELAEPPPESEPQPKPEALTEEPNT